MDVPIKKVTWSDEIDLGYNCTRLYFSITEYKKVNESLISIGSKSYEGIVPKSIVGDLFSSLEDMTPYRKSFVFWKQIEAYRDKLKKAKKKGGSKVPYTYEGEQLVYKEELTVEDIYNSIKVV